MNEDYLFRKPGPYTYADHLDAFPEIATRENAREIRALRRQGWSKKTLYPKVAALATKLKVPNNQHRLNQRALRAFIGSLLPPLMCQVVINGQRLAIGGVLQGKKIKSIGRDRRVYFDDGSMVLPTHLDPDRDDWRIEDAEWFRKKA